MAESFPVAWGSITGKECHDAGGREGIGNLFITLESALMIQGHVREPMDFVVLCVPTSKRELVEGDFEGRFGTPAVMN